MSEQDYYNALYKWSDKYFKGLDEQISASSIKVKTDDDGSFVSARFVVIVRLDLKNWIDREITPNWAVEVESGQHHFDNTITCSPMEFNIKDQPISPSSNIQVSKPTFYKRYYDIAVPFEMVEDTPNALYPVTIAIKVGNIAKSEAIKYLEKNDYRENGEVAFIEVKAWDNFPDMWL